MEPTKTTRTHAYGERDYAFGQVMVTLRTVMHLTQIELAQSLQVSRHAVQGWEAGSRYPKAENLKRFIARCVQQQAFAAGREEEEIRALWRTAHQKVLVDEHWLSALLGERFPPLPGVTPGPSEGAGPPALPAGEPAHARRVDWEEAVAVPSFYGRTQELATLEQWIVQERCQLVCVVGMGGIGKSTLAVTLMRRLVERFEIVLFRSLRDAPSYEVLLLDCLKVLSPRLPASLPESLLGRLGLLLEALRERRALLVLDNLEALLLEGEIAGHYRPGYQEYGRLLRWVGETAHQSCLLVTSREKPAELVPLEARRAPVRVLRLAGLDAGAGAQLLAEEGLVGTPQDWARLVKAYVGNPLALKVVARTIVDLFGGEIGPFLTQGMRLFGSIQQLLAEQVSRLSALEQMVLRVLAIGLEPLSLQQLLARLVAPWSAEELLTAVESLRRRSLIEPGQRPGSLMLQSVVLEYVTKLVIESAAREITQGRLDSLLEYGLALATAKDHLRETQERLLLAPILAHLRRVYPRRAEVEERLLALLAQLRERAQDTQGYGPANLVALLRELRGHLRGLDLSQLALREAYLQGVEMQDTTLAGAIVRDTVWTSVFEVIWALATSKSGQYWAVGCRHGEVRVWREAGQTLHLGWPAHTDTVTALTFSPDEGRLVSGSLDGSLTLWEVEHAASVWTVWQPAMVLSLAFAPDGGTLASSAHETTVRLWDAHSGTPRETLLYPGPVFALAWSPDGHLLASGNFDGRIWVWQMQATQPATCVARLVGHTSWVAGLAFAPDGTKLASASLDGTVRLWEVESGRCLHTLLGHTERVHSVAWSPDGHSVASAGFDATIWLWDPELGSARAVLQGHSDPVYSLAFTLDSHSLLSGSEDGTLRVWDLARRQCVRLVQGHAVCLSDVAWSPDGTQLASAGSDRLVNVWDVTDRRPPRVLRGHRWSVSGVGWSPDGKTLASSGWDNAIRLWNPDTGLCVQVLQNTDDPHNAFRAVAWSPDGRRLASGSFLHGMQVWDVTAGSPRWVSCMSPTMIRRVTWSPDGTRLASSGEDGSVDVWDASDGTRLSRLQGHHGMVASVVWSPDGKRIASGGGRDSGEVLLWDAYRGERLHSFADAQGRVLALDWSSRAELLVSGSSDGRLCWWDVQSGECVRMQEAHQGAIHSLRISSDGHRLASCGDDGAIKVWDLESGEWLRTLRRDRPYERLDITGVKGLTEAQKATLRALGAIEERVLPL